MADFIPPKITATIVGNIVAPAEEKFDGNLTELRVAVNKRKKDRDTGEWVDNGTDWITYKASGEWGAPLKQFGKGDRIRITDAVLETREFEKRDGNSGLALDARFGTVELLEAKGDRPAATDDTW